eukprot:GHUV01002553.1.p1 GENE.GHUV01002553.1~~GHUV01002553.1.p1  ORF type:complete len:377 (+),score=85.65 GHUV01002553.1:2054-3184(+)
MIAESETPEELENIVIEWSSNFDPIHVATVFNKAAKLAGNRPQKAWPLARTVAKAWDQLLPGAGPRAAASVLWGAAKLHFADDSLWKDTLETFVLPRSLRAANCMDLANTAYALGTMAQVSKGEVPGVPRNILVDAMCSIMDEAYVFAKSPDPSAVNAQDLANLLWACAQLHCNPGDDKLDALLQAYTRSSVLEYAIPVNISSVHSATTTLVTKCGYQPHIAERLWRKLFTDELVVKRLANDSPTRVSETAYHLMRLWRHMPSYITAEIARDSMSLLLTGRAAQSLVLWKLLDVSTVLWAVALLDMRDGLWFVKAATDVLSSKLQRDSLTRNIAQRLGITHGWLVQNGLLGGDGLATVLTTEQLQLCEHALGHSRM